jgi:hypothetical protein
VNLTASIILRPGGRAPCRDRCFIAKQAVRRCVSCPCPHHTPMFMRSLWYAQLGILNFMSMTDRLTFHCSRVRRPRSCDGSDSSENSGLPCMMTDTSWGAGRGIRFQRRNVAQAKASHLCFRLSTTGGCISCTTQQWTMSRPDPSYRCDSSPWRSPCPDSRARPSRSSRCTPHRQRDRSMRERETAACVRVRVRKARLTRRDGRRTQLLPTIIVVAPPRCLPLYVNSHGRADGANFVRLLPLQIVPPVINHFDLETTIGFDS